MSVIGTITPHSDAEQSGILESPSCGRVRAAQPLSDGDWMEQRIQRVKGRIPDAEGSRLLRRANHFFVVV